MRAAVLREAERLIVEDWPEPVVQDGCAVVEVTLAGVCGTDLALWSGNYPVDLPLIPGHEFVGRVIATDMSGRFRWPGQRVTASINNACGPDDDACEACQQGMPEHCIRRTVTGIIDHAGTFAERIQVPVRNLFAVPDTITDQEAVFIEPVAAAIETFERSRLETGETVVVLGAGRLGYLIAAVALQDGARVLAVAQTKETCERVEDLLGIETVRHKKDAQTLKAVRAWLSRQGTKLGTDHVVDATGTGDGATLALAAKMVRPRGTIHLKSTPGAFTPPIPITDIVVNEVRLQGSRCGPFDKAISLLTRRPFRLRELIDATFPLADAQSAFKRAQNASKVVIACQS